MSNIYHKMVMRHSQDQELITPLVVPAARVLCTMHVSMVVAVKTRLRVLLHHGIWRCTKEDINVQNTSNGSVSQSRSWHHLYLCN